MNDYDLNELMGRQNSAMLEAETFIDDEIADILANPEVLSATTTSREPQQISTTRWPRQVLR